LHEKNEFDKNNGTFIQAKGIPEIFINKSYEKTVFKNKNMVLINDIVEFE
jgi:hypothetical protein